MQMVTFGCMFCFADKCNRTSKRTSESWVFEYMIHVWIWSERSGHSKGSQPVNVLWLGTMVRLGGAQKTCHVLIGETNQSIKKKRLWGRSTRFRIRLSQNATKEVLLIPTLKSLLDHKNVKNIVWVHVFIALQLGPLLLLPSLLAVITVVIAGRWRIHPQGKHGGMRRDRGTPLCCSPRWKAFSYWKLSSKQVLLFPDAFNWFCSSTSKRQPSSSVGQRRGSRGLSWPPLQSPSNPRLPATPAGPAAAISIHGNAADSLYRVKATWHMEN